MSARKYLVTGATGDTSVSRYLDTEGMALYLLQHLTEVCIDHGNGLFAGTNSLVEELGGVKQSPKQLEEFVLKNRAAFVAA